MPAGTLISASTLKTLGLDGLFEKHYADETKNAEAFVKDMFLPVEVKTDRVQFAALYDSPVPVEWQSGDGLPWQSMDDFSHTVLVKRFARGIPWDQDDEADDQLQTIEPRVQDLAKQFANIPNRMAQDMLTGVAGIFSTVPTSYDGAVLISSSTRFGSATGQTVTGTGMTPGGVRDDFYSLKALFQSFRRHTATNEQFWAGDEVGDNRNWTLIFSTDGVVQSTVAEAFYGPVILDRTGVAGVSNPLATANVPKIAHWFRVSGNDWYGVYTGSASRKPFLLGLRNEAPILMTWEDMNSDWAREYNLKGKAWRQRIAGGIAMPECVGKVDVDN